MSIVRIILALVVIVAIFEGYKYYQKMSESDRQAEYLKFASAISEVSVAAELCRNDSDLFLIARDSILKSYDLSIQSIDSFKAKLSDNKREWAKVWEHVLRITDSLVEEQLLNMRTDTSDSAVDTPGIK